MNEDEVSLDEKQTLLLFLFGIKAYELESGEPLAVKEETIKMIMDDAVKFRYVPQLAVDYGDDGLVKFGMVFANSDDEEGEENVVE